jgi:hypothetical protein
LLSLEKIAVEYLAFIIDLDIEPELDSPLRKKPQTERNDSPLRLFLALYAEYDRPLRKRGQAAEAFFLALLARLFIRQAAKVFLGPVGSSNIALGILDRPPRKVHDRGSKTPLAANQKPITAVVIRGRDTEVLHL